jgi:hypothetical protein
MQPFTCKSCGASNQKSFENICDFCGAAGPVIKSAPPLPLPENRYTQEKSITDQLIQVSASGFVCMDCHSYDYDPDTKMPGSIVVEVALYFCYFFPGLIYSIWRRWDGNRIKVCRMCDSEKLITVMSPEGRVLFKKKYGKYPRFD